MSIKNFSDILASEMLTKLASKEHKAIFGSQDVSFAKDKCKNCGCHKDKCKCGDMAYADDGDDESFDEEGVPESHTKSNIFHSIAKDLIEQVEERMAYEGVELDVGLTALPKVKEVADELEAINKDCDEECDVRLQVYENGSWAIRVGPSDYDQDHHGYFGASSLPGPNKDHEHHEDGDSGIWDETRDEDYALDAAASKLISASEALDAVGFSKSAMDTLHLAKLVIAAKKKKMKEKSSKDKTSDKSSKKTAPKDTKKSTKPMKSFVAKKKEAPAKRMEKADSSNISKEKSSVKKSNPFKSSK